MKPIHLAILAALPALPILAQNQVPPGVQAHRDVAYVEGGHERHKLDLYLSAEGTGPFPLVIWVHGGGWQNGSKDGCPPLRGGYLERGYAVASINYRLSGHAPFPAQIEDCKAAIRWLRAHAADYRLDSGRFGVWGSSAGGHLVALLGTSGEVTEFAVGDHLEVSSHVQAVCDFYGPTDLVAFVQTPGYERHADPGSPESKLIGGAVLDKADEAARANPITYVDQQDPPFLIVHGDQDRTVPINQSELLFAALQSAGVSAQFHVLRGAGHGGPDFAGPEVSAMVAAFFAERLANGGSSKIEAKRTESAGTTGVVGRGPRPAAIVPRPAASKVNLAGLRLDGERWAYRDGDFAMEGILLKPQGNGPFPAVLISHGLGGSAQSFGMMKAREMVQWGMVCIAPDYAHAGRAGDRTLFGASAENIRRANACLDLLRAMPEVDATRLAAYGHSMGGFVTIGLASADEGAVKVAAITGSGVAPQDGFPAPSARAAEKIRTPFLILHGANDTTVRPEQSAALQQALDRNKVPNERIVAEGHGHPLDQTMRDEVFRRIREWFQKHGVLK